MIALVAAWLTENLGIGWNVVLERNYYKTDFVVGVSHAWKILLSIFFVAWKEEGARE